MGILEKIFGRKREREIKPLALDIDALKTWIDERTRKEEKRIGKVAEKKAREILELRDSAIEIVEYLRDYEFPEEIQKRVHKPILTAKPVYTKGMYDALAGIKFSASDSISKFHALRLNQLKTVQTMQLNQGKLLAHIFREEMLKLGGILNRIMDLTAEIGKEIDNERTAVLREIASGARDLESRIKELEELSGTRAEEDIKKIEKEEREVTEKIASLEKTEDFKTYCRGKEKIEDIERKIDETRARALNTVGPLSKALRKYRKLVEGGKTDFKNMKIIESYIENPMAKLLEDKNLSSLGAILEELRELIEKKELSVKNEKKVLKRIDTAARDMPEIKGALERLENSRKAIRKEISSSHTVREIEKLREEREELEKRRGAIEREAASKSERIAEMRREIKELKKNLERKLSKFRGRRVTLKLP